MTAPGFGEIVVPSVDGKFVAPTEYTISSGFTGVVVAATVDVVDGGDGVGDDPSWTEPVADGEAVEPVSDEDVASPSPVFVEVSMVVEESVGVVVDGEITTVEEVVIIPPVLSVNVTILVVLQNPVAVDCAGTRVVCSVVIVWPPLSVVTIAITVLEETPPVADEVIVVVSRLVVE